MLFSALGERLGLQPEGPPEAQRDQIVSHTSSVIMEVRRLGSGALAGRGGRRRQL